MAKKRKKRTFNSKKKSSSKSSSKTSSKSSSKSSKAKEVARLQSEVQKLQSRVDTIKKAKAAGYKGNDDGEAADFLKGKKPITPKLKVDDTGGDIDISGLPPELQATYRSLEQYLKDLEKKGKTINPNIEITPEKVAEFTRQAEQEINPYYSSQLKLARESLLKDIGYSTDQIVQSEKQAELGYKTGLRTLSEDAADTGFAQSGRRQLQEQELAQETQTNIDENRKALANQAGGAARSFAQLYGGSELPDFQVGQAPRVFGGEQGFSQTGTNRSLYQLDPSIYQSLVGSEEFNRRGAVKSRASELEEAFRSNEALKQQRSLTL